MTALTEYLKKRNRTLLELQTGIIVLNLLFWLTGALVLCFVKGSQAVFGGSVLLGCVTALISALDMYRTLDRSLDYGEKAARRGIYLGYLKRYAVLGVILAITCVTDLLHPIFFFVAYMMLKLAAYLQPFTHRIYNRIFHETDPVPMSLEELEALEALQHSEDKAPGSAVTEVPVTENITTEERGKKE
ncbi:MAG: ATP synthase subunit I [Lachnospiraceae bacterium]|nr:ATP synthase subunit I [Lachnospiraceae bacterium]